jgi:hypothetical protein
MSPPINTIFMVFMALGFVLLLVLVIYLVDRVNTLESNTRNLQQEGRKAAPADAGPFGGLSGKKLWDAMSGKPPEGWDAERVGDIRERYAVVLPKHIEMLFGEGVSDAKSGLSGTPRNTRMIGTLRGNVESWLPTLQNGVIYQCGVDSSQALPENLAAIRQRLDEACADLYQQTQLSLRQPMSTILMPETVGGPASAPPIADTPENTGAAQPSSSATTTPS